MKREDLQKIEGLTKEQIDSIMNLHQTDVTGWNTKFENQKKDIQAKDKNIQELTDQVKNFEGVDVEKLKKDITDWETKYNDDMAAARKDSAIKLALAKSNPRNEKAVMALLDKDIIKIDKDGNVTGLKEQMETIQKENDFLFGPVEPKNNDVNLGGNHNGSKPESQPSKKSVEQVAREVIQGKWGNGAERRQRLKRAGYDYNTIQTIVNRML